MNAHASEIDRVPTDDEVRAARDVLRRHNAAEPSSARLATTYPTLAADAAYRAGLPDVQNAPASAIRGADRRIQHVGIAGFKVPMRVATRAGEHLAQVTVTGTVGLEAGRKGINMSRIMRRFYEHADGLAGFALAEAVLDAYAADPGGGDARLLMRYALPLRVPSLRSGLEGWQYYDVGIEAARAAGRVRRVLHVDYVYSSTCPCSLALSEHARATRGQLATPHSQRSVARLSVEVAGDATAEDVIDACRGAVPTETQVMVKREDEQAFAELNAANPVFVEDAARLFAGALAALPGAGDFRVVAVHQESLHSHDAVSVLVEGDLFAADVLEPGLFGMPTAR